MDMMKFINNEKILKNTKSGTIMHNNVKSEQHVHKDARLCIEMRIHMLKFLRNRLEEDRNFCSAYYLEQPYQVLSTRCQKVYTSCTAAFLRAKECVMNTVSTVQRMPETSISAKEINETRTKLSRGICRCRGRSSREDRTAENTEE